MTTMTRLLSLGLCCLLLGGCAGGAQPAAGDGGAKPSLQLTDMEGVPRDLDAELAAGRSVALVFWQTWCESCEGEAPAIAAAAREFGDRIAFVGVVPGKPGTVDDDEVRRVSSEWGYASFPQVRDPELALTKSMRVTGTPTLIVLGPDGKERFRGHEPPADWGTFADGPAGVAGAECKDGVCPLPAE